MKSNCQKQRFCHPKMADLKAWSHGVRKANFQCFKAECFVQRTKFERKTTILNLKRIMNAKTIRTMK